MSKTEEHIETAALETELFASGGDNLIPDHGGGIDAIINLANKARTSRLVSVPTTGLGDGLPEEVPLLFNQETGQVTAIGDKIETYRQSPKRRAGTATATTLKSFIDLANRHKDDDSVIFGKTSWPEPALTAVFNYHGIDHTPRHRDHRALYQFPVTDELTAWIEGNNIPMEQGDFAAFLEDHAAELSAPFDAERSDYERLFKERFATPNELIDLSRHLEVFVGAKVKRGERLSSGERTVEFTEEHLNGAGEKIEIPGVFMISVPAWIDGEAVRIPARLRYRIAGGTIKWLYSLYRWEAALRERIQNDLAEAGKQTGLPVFEGAPE